MINSLSSIYMYHVLLLILHVLLLGTSCSAKKNHLCSASSCGEIGNISFPFRLKGDPKDCGLLEYELSCENNRTVLYLYAGRYYVKSIHSSYYHNKHKFYGNITVVDDGVQKGNCSSLPRYSLAFSNFTLPSDVYTTRNGISSPLVVLVKCSHPIDSTSYVDAKPCIEGAYSSGMPPDFSQTKAYSYAIYGNGQTLTLGEIKDSCTITIMALASGLEGDQYNRVSLPYKGIHDMIAEGYSLSFVKSRSSKVIHYCHYINFRYQGKDCD